MSAQAGLARTGGDFREARLGASLTLREVGVAIGKSHSEVSRIERGQALRVPYETLVMLGSALGLDVPLRTYPSGEPLRDAAQLALLERLRLRLAPGLSWRTEVPLAIPGDLRAWDAAIGGAGRRVCVDAESRLRDIQACSRRFAHKRRDDGANLAILLVADTRHNRHVLRVAMPGLLADFPLAGRAVLAALASGRPPEASGVVLL